MVEDADADKEQGKEGGSVTNHPTSGMIILESRKEPEFVCLRSPCPIDLLGWIQAHPLFRRHIDGLFVAESRLKGIDEAVQWVRTRWEEMNRTASNGTNIPAPAEPVPSVTASSGSACIVFRLHCYPRSLRDELLGPLTSPSASSSSSRTAEPSSSTSSHVPVPLHPLHYTHVLSVMKAFGKLHVGIVERSKMDFSRGGVSKPRDKNKDKEQKEADNEDDGADDVGENGVENGKQAEKQANGAAVIPSATECIVPSCPLSTVAPHSLSTSSLSAISSSSSPSAADSDIDVLSRAYWKLVETFLVDRHLKRIIQPGSLAIDIGASPGGWSSFLASSAVGCRVLAIDPGEVHCESSQVTHVRKKVEQAMEDGDIDTFIRQHSSSIKDSVTPSQPRQHDEAKQVHDSSPDGSGLKLIVCDMNVRPAVSVELILNLVSNLHRSLIHPNAALVLTCKETVAGRSKKLVQDAMLDLSPYFHHFRVTHHLSNGKERTLVADFLPLFSSEERQAKLQHVTEEKARIQKEWEEKIRSQPMQNGRKQPTMDG